MDIADFFRKAGALFYFSPSERYFSQTTSFISDFRKNASLLPAKDMVYKRLYNSGLHQNWIQLIEIMTEIFTNIHDREKYDVKISKLGLPSDIPFDDSIHSPEIQNLLKKGFAIMEKTRDPFHDIGHLYRSISYARILYDEYAEQKKLDWGTIITALVWHDISRAYDPGLFYNHPFLRHLEHLPFLVDISIIKNGLTDAQKSGTLFMQAASQVGLERKRTLAIYGAIQGTSPQHISAKNPITADIYFQIVSDADLIDLYSIGKFESAVRNVRENNMTSLKFFNRCILLAALLLRDHREKYLRLEISKTLFDFSVYNLYTFSKECYPQDTTILIENYIQEHMIKRIK